MVNKGEGYLLSFDVSTVSFNKYNGVNPNSRASDSISQHALLGVSLVRIQDTRLFDQPHLTIRPDPPDTLVWRGVGKGQIIAVFDIKVRARK